LQVIHAGIGEALDQRGHSRRAADAIVGVGSVRVEDLEALGPELIAAAQLPAGSRKITRLNIDGVPQKAIFASAQVARLDKPVTVLSILPVQSELGALEVSAQVDLSACSRTRS